MSKKFEMVKNYYDKGLWNKKMVYNVVGKLITAEEYELITKQNYYNI